MASLGSTVIITTHYLEEVKAAGKIGFARQGRILAENSPGNFMKEYNTQSLEAIFHELCSNDGENFDQNVDESAPLLNKSKESNGPSPNPKMTSKIDLVSAVLEVKSN